MLFIAFFFKVCVQEGPIWNCPDLISTTAKGVEGNVGSTRVCMLLTAHITRACSSVCVNQVVSSVCVYVCVCADVCANYTPVLFCLCKSSCVCACVCILLTAKTYLCVLFCSCVSSCVYVYVCADVCANYLCVLLGGLCGWIPSLRGREGGGCR
jgi:hypothetical protein